MTNVLDAILASKSHEIEALADFETASRGKGARLDALARRTGEPLRLVAELKKKSPSAGTLSTALTAPERALAYARSGATMISVLCDGPFFGGSFGDLESARAALDAAALEVPLLAKEFVLDARQIARAAAAGADSVLLIARIVSGDELKELVCAARAHGLEPLVEVVTERELEAALAAHATVIGVNARDLDTLVIDAPRAARVLAAVPDTCIAVHLSGLRSPEDVATVARSSVDAALVGEALMRLDDPAALLGAMVIATRS